MNTTKRKRGRPKGRKWYHSINTMTDYQVIWHSLTELQRRTTVSDLYSRLDKIKLELIDGGEFGHHRNTR